MSCWQCVPIRESGEPLVLISADALIQIEWIFRLAGYEGALKAVHLRKWVAERLRAAAEQLPLAGWRSVRHRIEVACASRPPRRGAADRTRSTCLQSRPGTCLP